jgi:phosphoadenosine phosphosulfate reductase
MPSVEATRSAASPTEPEADETAALSAELAPLRAGERIRLLRERFGSRLVASTSFGIQSAVMLHLIHQHAPDVPVVFIDTGFLFPETYRYADQLTSRLGLDVRIYQPSVTAARMQALWGNLWEQGEEGAARYAMLTKIEPMNRALREIGADVWISGLRRSQSGSRGARGFAERQKRTIKAYPILDWADAQVDHYLHEHDLPVHPLAAEGYVTTGDWHSTRPLGEGGREATRFNGKNYECGLHLDSGATDFQI